jgi:hypothetical protein
LAERYVMFSLKTRSKSVAKKGLMAGITEPMVGLEVAIGWRRASLGAGARRRIAGADAIADISVVGITSC